MVRDLLLRQVQVSVLDPDLDLVLALDPALLPVLDLRGDLDMGEVAELDQRLGEWWPLDP